MNKKLINYFFLLNFFGSLVHADAGISQLKQFINLQDFTAAVTAGELILSQQPDNAEAQFFTAFALQKQGVFPRAVELYQRLIEAYPDSPEPKNNLAIIYQKQGDFDKASELLIAAIDTSHSYATAYQNLNRIYTDLARVAYRRAISVTNQPESDLSEIQLSALNSISLAEIKFNPTISENIETPDPKPEIINNKYSDEKHKQELVGHLNSWINAWNNHQFARYIDHYEVGFNPDSIRQHNWIRKQFQLLQINGPLQIVVNQIDFQFLHPEMATIQFEQVFKSSRKQDKILKQLQLVHIGGQWKISGEQVISVL